jgi:hypothetical protein
MAWFIYRDDLFIPMEVRALTIDEAVRAGLRIAKDVLGSVDRYCLYEGGGEVIIEYWRGREVAVKLIYADDPARALMHFYDAERLGAVTCMELSD